MAILENLEPKSVFYWFEQLSAIPRGSRHTKQVSDWCVKFAQERGFKYYQDGANNIIIYAPGNYAPDNNNANSAADTRDNSANSANNANNDLILQGHLDMVCEKNPDCLIDMDRQGPELMIDGEYVRANGTTLGGDDGIAVAMALAILDDKNIRRPPLEVVLTTDEEIGMLGAAALDASRLKGRRMLNIDSEQEGVFTVSCAGGRRVSCILPVTREACHENESFLRIILSGLTGGHSGSEIHHGRGNADIILSKILKSAREKVDFKLIKINGGLKDNAIPVASSAEIAVKNSDLKILSAILDKTAETARLKYINTDPDFKLNTQIILPEDIDKNNNINIIMDNLSTKRVIDFLSNAPDGVQAMDENIPGFVKTSLNLGILETDLEQIRAMFCVRSGVTEDKLNLTEKLKNLAMNQGGYIEIQGDYPAWEYKADSPLRDLCERVFYRQYGHAPKIEAIHAGLECGLFAGKIPDLDCISIGPDLPEIHTPREKMSIQSVKRVWAFLLEVLRVMADEKI